MFYGDIENEKCRVDLAITIKIIDRTVNYDGNLSTS